MTHLIRNALAICLTLLIATAALAQSVEIRAKDGSRWRGRVADPVHVVFLQSGVQVTIEGTLTANADLYVKISGKIGGISAERTIFKSDIVSIKSAEGSASPAVGEAVPTASPQIETSDNPSIPTNSGTPAATANGQPLGVFVLPMKGMVGLEFRHDEIEAVAREADKFGPGQIIVLEIESGGGLAIEMELIHYSIKEIKKRHRVVAWIREAISAAAATASNCDEIYFTSTGTLGAMTMFAGTKSVQGEELRKWMELAGRMFESGGRSKYIAWAMIDEKAELSYDKDPVTGKVTWYNDLSGQVDLSDDVENLVFTAQQAMDCRFADGIADTKEDLAKLLNLPKWHEISDYSRRLAADWEKTVKRAQEELPLLFDRYRRGGGVGGDPIASLGKQIQILQDIIDWWKKCPNVCAMAGVPPREELERQIAELRRQLAQMRRR